jgi:hypothetical protein
MPHDELVALITRAYKHAGVCDPERLAAAFAADISATGTAIPPCPECLSRASRHAVWTGALPDGGDSWRCAACGSKWATPAGSTP